MAVTATNVAAGAKAPAWLAFEHLRRTVPMLVIDHGRAGNAFFMSVFDRHPQVLVIPHVGYLLFKLSQMYGKRERASGAEAFKFIMDRTDFRYVAQDMSEEIALEYSRLGNDPSFVIDRAKTRRVFSMLMESAESVSKADVIAAVHAAYAIGTGKEVSQVKYILMNDQPLHYQLHSNLTLPQACCELQGQFGALRMIHLVRDPRAAYASLRHQFVKEQNGAYPFTARSLLGAVRSVFWGRAAWCAWLNVLEYTAAGSRELVKWRKPMRENFYVVRNEDLNLRFVPTMQALVKYLEVKWFAGWSDPHYAPTSGGELWISRAAYDGTYLSLRRRKAKGKGGDGSGREAEGLRFNAEPYFQDDSPGAAASITGPNSYVTERWKSRLSRREIALAEAVYYEEMAELGYERIGIQDPLGSRLRGLAGGLLPLPGEMFSGAWVRSRLRGGLRSSIHLLVDSVFLVLYFVCARLALIRLYSTGRLRSR